MSSASLDRDTVPGRLARRAAESPSAIAFQYEDDAGHWSPVTWAGFAQRVEGLRRGLSACGLRAGDRLALVAPVSLEWEVLHHAALSLGVVVVGLDAHDLPERIAGMVEIADITAFATASPQILAQLPPERWARCRLALQLGPTGTAWRAGVGAISWAELVERGVARGTPATEGPAADAIATIIFTSGTTGSPKGIAYTHAQLCMAIDAIAEAFPFVGPGSRLLCWLPLSNLFQRIVNLAGMERGAASHLLGDPRRVMAVVGHVEPDVFIGVPRFYEKLYDGVRERVAALPPWQRGLVNWAWQVGRRSSPHRQRHERLPWRLRLAWAVADRAVLRKVRAVMGHRLQCMVTGSAPTPIHLLEEFHALGWLVLEAYGMSENVMPMAMNRVDAYRFGTVGRPLSGNRLAIGPDKRITVQGPAVFRRYLGDAQSREFDAAGYYITGDLGEIDDAGYLKLSGRTGELIKTSTGRRVAPARAEALIQQVPGIDQVVLIGAGRKYLVALCTCPAPELTDAARKKLAEEIAEKLALLAVYERPRGFAFLTRAFSIQLGELTTNLKIRRSAIENAHRELIDYLYEQVEDGSNPASVVVVWAGDERHPMNAAS